MTHPHSLTVTGTGSAAVVPDIAVLRTGAEVRAPRLRDAYDGASRASEAMVAAALGLGIARSDIASSSLSVTPEMTWEEGQGQRLVGYSAGRGLTITARDISRTGELLDAIVAAGADAVRIHGLSLGVSDASAARSSAQEAAFRDAHAAAQRLAGLAGRPLGAVMQVEAGWPAPSPGTPVPVHRVAFAAGVSAPVEAGEAEITASVTVTWELGAEA
jgi:uncharacterized protein YggE